MEVARNDHSDGPAPKELRIVSRRSSLAEACIGWNDSRSKRKTVEHGDLRGLRERGCAESMRPLQASTLLLEAVSDSALEAAQARVCAVTRVCCLPLQRVCTGCSGRLERRLPGVCRGVEEVRVRREPQLLDLSRIQWKTPTRMRVQGHGRLHSRSLSRGGE